MRGGRAGEPDAGSDKRVGEADLPVGDVIFPQQQHHEEAEQAEGVADEQRQPRAVRVHELRGARGDQHHEHGGGEDREPGVQSGVAEHVLQELLADEHRAHQRAEHDDPGAGGHPEDPAFGDVEVVQRLARAALADDERAHGGDRDYPQPDRQRSLAGHRGEVDPEHERGDEQHREDAAEVVDGVDSSR